MPSGPPEHSKDMGRLLALSQVGLEMVAPVAVGLALDHYLKWSPWATVAGAGLGLAGGLVHLVVLLNRFEDAEAAKRREKP
jgi:F0F1-type ATP synthase assembly protein I